ncbi:Tad domain-containing protein [Caldibacillus lycopersici]|uniref:Tad domain-containing protein n=1 Tax=Perspicuibacillus lycopersici TaxID=1325689 RepID=A0AAE3IS89_9BACI|nr:TadE/TadG family type IV pilus assembly protein [Perspicuibacillus lycopersici]MCU9613531.1 Tad domain-containing protein [Perspicuibacillus lycopersici]
MKSILQREDGAITLLTVFAMVVMLALMALVIDIGSLYLEKSKMQNIADAATLAGIQEMPNDYEQAKTEIKKTIQANGGNPDEYTISTNDNFTRIDVAGSKIGTLFFAKALGISEPTIQAMARAELLPLTTGKGAIPLGIQPNMDFTFGTFMKIKVSDSASGNFGAIALTGPGAKNYETDLTNGYQFDLSVGTILNTETGKMAGPTERAVNARIAKCPNATYLDYPTNCSRVVLVPIFEPVSINQNQIKQVKVVGFASFFLENASSTSSGAEVSGRFISVAMVGESSSEQTNYGTYSIKLTK